MLTMTRPTKPCVKRCVYMRRGQKLVGNRFQLAPLKELLSGQSRKETYKRMLSNARNNKGLYKMHESIKFTPDAVH